MKDPRANAPRLLFFVPTLVVGGAERHTVDLCERLRDLGFTCRILVHSASRSEVLTKTPGASDAIFLNLKGMSEASGWPKVWRVLRAWRPDVVIAVNQTPMIIAALVRLALPRKPKLACIFHTTQMQNFEAYQRRLFWLAIRAADLLVYVGETQRAIWTARGIRPRQATVIRNGIDAMRFIENEGGHVRSKLRIGEEALLLGIIASFRVEKNHAELVRALARVRADGLDAYVLFIGDGPTRLAIEELGRTLGVGERLMFAGEQEDVRPYIASCDIGVLCSTAETFPLSLLEFLAGGVPVIASRVGGVAEIVHHERNGLVYELGDVAGFADAISRCAVAPFRARLAAEARASVAPFSIEAMVNAYARAFGALASDARAEGNSSFTPG